MAEHLKQMPERTFDYEPYFRAYNVLRTCCGIGMDIGPVPWTAIDAFARRHEIEGLAFEKLEAIILAIDGEMAQRRSEKNAAGPQTLQQAPTGAQQTSNPVVDQKLEDLAAAAKFAGTWRG